MGKLYIQLFLIFLLSITTELKAQTFDSFIEFGTTLHGGSYVPLWQVSNVHGFSSVDNHAYLRGGVFYDKKLNNWKFSTGIDVGVTTGFSSKLIIQQAYFDASYKKWFGISFGSKELDSPLLNQQLSSGGLTWSGNARPIPQLALGIFDYIPLRRNILFKGKISYGLLTDNNYQKKQVGDNYWYTKDIKYHHKSFFFRFGKPQGRWVFDLGMSLDCFFGGYNIGGGIFSGDLGNSLKDYWRAFIPQNGNWSSSQTYFQGNFMGSEHLKLTYNHPQVTVSAYLENYYDDFSGMLKQNGGDGLWGMEFALKESKAINKVVIEYYQTTHQSGPLHGPDDSVVKKTNGADDYYNNHWYPAWAHWGMTMANPLIASPIYNKDGDMTVKYNRVKAIHLGWSGIINKEISYTSKLSYNQTWGTPFKPTIDILENFSTFVEGSYFPERWPLWSVKLSVAFDIGEIYGDNIGIQVKVKRKF